MDNTVLAKSIFEAEDFQPLLEHRGDDVVFKETIPEGAYAVLVLGLYHGLLIPNDFGPAARSTPVNPHAFDRVLVELAIAGALLASLWRVATTVYQQTVPRGRRGRTKEPGT